MTAFTAFLDSGAGHALLGMVGVAFADFLTGTFAALRDGTFSIDALAAFLRKHIWGRVAPIGSLLVLGYFGPGVLGQLFMLSAIASASAYIGETAGSIVGNLAPPKTGDVKAGIPTVAEALNPIPKD